MLVELAARVLNAVASRAKPANADGHAVNYASREKNSAGFHDVEWTIEKPADTWRLVVLGDSFTMGEWIPRDQLFVKRLERAIDAESGRKRRVELLNVSLGGADTVDELSLLEKVGLKYSPDAVLVIFFVNDATHLDSNPLVVRRLNEEFERPSDGLGRISVAWDMFDRARRRKAVTREMLDEYRQSFFGDAAKQDQWKNCRTALARMAELSRAKNFRLGLAIFPMLIDLEPGHPLADLYAEVEHLCGSLAIPSLDLTPSFYGRSAPFLWVAPNDGHPNAIANEIVVEPLRAFVEANGLVPKPDDR